VAASLQLWQTVDLCLLHGERNDVVSELRLFIMRFFKVSRIEMDIESTINTPGRERAIDREPT
ncbi:hypothetical protein LINPERHAP1_LOCUS20423, partial [Linum perenne]